MGNPYYEDEYEDYDDYENEPEVWCCYSGTEIVKADNGQLYTVVWSLTRWEGQYWGEADGTEYACSLKVYRDAFRLRCIELGKHLKPGESTPFYWGDDDDEDDDSGGDAPVIPEPPAGSRYAVLETLPFE